MRRAAATTLALFALMHLAACRGDPSKPEYWDKAIGGAKSKKEKIRRVAELRDFKGLNDSFLPMLNKRLAEEKLPAVKSDLARVLAGLKSPSSVEALVESIDLTASDNDTRSMNKEITIALATIADKKAAPTLLKLLKIKGDNYTVIAAIEGLGEMKADEATDTLIDMAINENIEPFISKKAVQALGDIGNAKAVPVLVKMMFKERRGVSFYVESSYALYQIGQPAADALLPVLEEKDKELLKWAEDSKVMAAALPAKAAQVLGDLHDTRAEKALIKLLGFNSDMLDIKLFVRMRAADALGRLRSAAAVEPLSKMLDEDEATAREEYIRALIRIGGREGLPALTKSASKGSWDAREPAIIGIAMLGDGRELALFDKFTKDEEALFAAECKADPEMPACKDVPGAIKTHQGRITKHQNRLAAAKECEGKAECWAKKLGDADEGVRGRAAFEVGRSKNAGLVSELLKHLTESHLETRLSIIMATDWLISDSKEAAKTAHASLETLEKQIAAERSSTDLMKVNEDLKRLAVKIQRS